ncbi:conserved hypothetical protein [Talaromyces stipitatus ATCC 10500]|uniref:Metallo-beta-lactamase domain-containing protein n=1 Tax=Talaromyces stipitatus (strain ATCC 10500 / CBS 375.48 / QM 6759 / NRRL 1006) TaxID=441959 RepID=B8M5W0_TALSN|nr:uncharacterized protein TSTA_033330 [Talaromyces stipitatus ATCC 10500]EED20087.1 conserved hypothetical protein [Talaromyces stipitatus ATCC 10500]
MTSSTPFVPPYTGSTVDVSVILADGTGVPCAWMFKNAIPGHNILDVPCFSFLIENKRSGKKILYDLATFDVQQGVADQLIASNIPIDSINEIIWSHHHMDHTGDPSLFPSSTSLIVGSGFKSDKTTFPGWPRNPYAITVDDAFEGRKVIELDFSSSDLHIGGFPALDYFGDGSFYILQTRGHNKFKTFLSTELFLAMELINLNFTIAHDHISALARTAEDKFIFLGGDISHHPGEFRPTTQLPIPSQIDSSLLGNHIHQGASHPAIQKDDGSDCKTSPFYEHNHMTNASPQEAQVTIEKLQGFDCVADVFVVIVHDSSLLDILPFSR